jgi:oligopeptide transport system ATP-binding protein
MQTLSHATAPVLEVRDLSVDFWTPDGLLRAVDGVSFSLFERETLGIVGESGSGKSVSMLAVMGLLSMSGGRIVSGSVTLGGVELVGLSIDGLRRVRGRDIAMVFQDPMKALNPSQRIGAQIVEAIRVHREVTRAAARREAIDLLGLVGIPDPDRRAYDYPHQFSGGMRQRAMIAIAIANKPKVLIADEPTTALDVTIQAQVLELLATVREETGAATVLITHDLGLVAELADRVLVMYGGRIVESCDVSAIFENPRHPYTLGLLASLPRLDDEADALVPISGQPPDSREMPGGCAFHPRCQLMRGRSACRDTRPELNATTDSHQAACHFWSEMPSEIERVSAALGFDLTAGDP